MFSGKFADVVFYDKRPIRRGEVADDSVHSQVCLVTESTRHADLTTTPTERRRLGVPCYRDPIILSSSNFYKHDKVQRHGQ